MSSILKALKRLEQEKSVRRPTDLNVDAEIVREVQLQRRTPLPVIAIAAAALFAGGGAAVYLVVKPSAPPAPGVSAPVPVVELRHEAAPQRDAAPASAAPAAMKTAAPQKRASRPAAPVVQQKSAPSPAPVPVPVLPPASRNLPPQKPDAAQPSLPPASTPVQAAQPAETKKELRLDGIAFQDGGGESIAVINGRTVTRGATVDGARVEEILRDRVRLSRGGERLEIILDKSN